MVKIVNTLVNNYSRGIFIFLSWLLKCLTQMNLEKRRSSSMDKILNKLRRAQIKAEKKRSLIPEQQDQQVSKTWKFSLFKYAQIRSPNSCFGGHAPWSILFTRPEIIKAFFTSFYFQVFFWSDFYFQVNSTGISFFNSQALLGVAFSTSHQYVNSEQSIFLIPFDVFAITYETKKKAFPLIRIISFFGIINQDYFWIRTFLSFIPYLWEYFIS